MDCYDNRELSWLKFNKRVLEEAGDRSVPLGERLLFASIYQTNLDEFFMIRVGSLYDRTLVHDDAKDNKTDMTPAQQLKAIYKQVTLLSELRDTTYDDIVNDLLSVGVEHVHIPSLTGEEEAYLRAYFNSEIRPVISPQVVDKRHPFPFLENKAIYIAAHLETKNSDKLGLIPLNNSIPRMILLPDKQKLRFILAEDVLIHYCGSIFENYRIASKCIIRITRNADIDMEEGLYDHEVDLRKSMEAILKKRRKLSPVRLEINGDLDAEITKKLLKHLELKPGQVSCLSSPMDMSFIFSLRDRMEKAHPELFYEPFFPQSSSYINRGVMMIPQILSHDILLSYPYESIRPFISLLYEAGNDPDVVSIKITLYRVARNSKIIEALINAAENGKEVFVLVELRARFDEENNIGWSRELERAGCKVMYGPESLKVHSKLMLITRKIGGKLQYITQIGTGNYNEKTSELYTDLSLITADKAIGAEASRVFYSLSIGNLVENTNYLMVAPLALRNKICDLIDREIANAQSGREAYIGLKLNSITDRVLIDKLIEASCAGVRIDMVVRGICCIIPGIEGKTENITVKSIVGRFLEHARIYIFGKGEESKVYISSADFMTRNTIRRVEVAAPINSPEIKQRVLNYFNIQLSDNTRARIAQPDGSYVRAVPAKGETPVSAQDYFMQAAVAAAQKYTQGKPVRAVAHKVKRKMTYSTAFRPADILVPEKGTDMEKWAVVACDQFTSQREYWEKAREYVGDAPSTLSLILPEVYLNDDDVEARIESINAEMDRYLESGIFDLHKNAFVYVKRTDSTGKVREGLVGCIDLEQYDYRRGSTSQVRATEATVPERIPPRLKVRRDAALELPHIMILIDDPGNTVIEPLADKTDLKKLYDFDLMANGGHIEGYLVDGDNIKPIDKALGRLKEAHAADDGSVLLYAMGDGNHSLATAKEHYETLKRNADGADMSEHPARYALVEIVNLHSPALEFEAIHRIVTGIDPDDFLNEMKEKLSLEENGTSEQRFTFIAHGSETNYGIGSPASNLCVGSVQGFIDAYIAEKGGSVDYIHGADVVRSLAKEENAAGILLPDMEKSQLFPTVIKDGALPRKTFSMGHAEDKRYYVEARKIR